MADARALQGLKTELPTAYLSVLPAWPRAVHIRRFSVGRSAPGQWNLARSQAEPEMPWVHGLA
jgi:hypothetical protein